LVRDEIPPVLHARVTERSDADAEVLRTPGIGRDDQLIVMMVDAVFVTGLAGRNEPRLIIGLVAVDEIDLVRLMIVSIDDDELARLRGAYADVIARIRLRVDRGVRLARGADEMAADEARTMVLVEPNVEQRAIVVRPDHAAARVDDDVGQVLAGIEVANPDRVELGAL